MEVQRTTIIFLALWLLNYLNPLDVAGVQIISKSRLEKCEKNSNSDDLNCTMKIVVNMAVPSGSSGGEASIVAEIVEVEENSTNKVQTLRIPPVITVNKSAAYALYELTYIRDVPYKPEEYYVKTRKCEPDAGEEVVKICARLRDDEGHVIEKTQPICCPCGPQRRMPSSCGNFFDKLTKGKANTAHCVRFPGEWFHVFSIGRRTLGFSVLIQVKTGTKVSEVVVGPENRTVTSDGNFLRVNLIGDFVGYTNIPSFEDFYLVVPRQGGPGQPQDLGRNFSAWMLLERVRFTLDGLECNKIGVSYEAFNGQPNFCSSPFWSCLHNQLWNFREADLNRINRNQVPLYGVEGRFERINQHPNAGTHSFSIGITEVLNTNLVLELSANDVEYVYQRSPGKILSVSVPTFEALTQSGVATITTKNTGEVEASYSLTFNCSNDVTLMEEQFLIMKPNEITTRSFKIFPTTNQAAKYFCAAILKDSDYTEVDRAECQFTTTATVLDNGSQVPQGIPFQPPETSKNGFFDSIEIIWNKIWASFKDFITGKNCRQKCSGFFDLRCHIQYICLSWIVLFGLFLAIVPVVLVILWLLHEKGVFDPLYEWWEDTCGEDERRMDRHKLKTGRGHHHSHDKPHRRQELKHPRHGSHYRRKSSYNDHKHKHSQRDPDYYYYLHNVQKDIHKHGHKKDTDRMPHVDDKVGNHKRRKEGQASKGLEKVTRHNKEARKM
ncbi:protein HAPLESS 2 [Neltuma alba]|uniref:protein HAPLESS 2 n=1 Tax=Neltuma alba TaxID=207710 RepID=UPI0010A4C83E|nr:protein HAPLESS 2 [Prosopis alba]